jgi:hypothetical protein
MSHRKNTIRTKLNIFCTIKPSSGGHRLVKSTSMYSPDDALIARNIESILIVREV